MSVFRLSNKIFDLKLSAQEMTLYAYLCSLPSETSTIDGASAIKVKQSTIAQKCGIKAIQTVSKIITRLAEKKLVKPLKREIKTNRQKGTYTYIVKKLPTNDSFFFVDKHVFGCLVPYQMMIYLFLCKSYSTQLRNSWNSYNDISAHTCIKRETVIRIISELEAMKFIVKSRRKSRSNRRVYVDNHYQIIFFVKGKINKYCKKIARLHSKYNRTGIKLLKNSTKYKLNDNTFLLICQEKLKNFSGRGSP